MPDVTLPTPDEVAGMRERHDATCWCLNDTYLAPMCDVARLLALVRAMDARLSAWSAAVNEIDQANRHARRID